MHVLCQQFAHVCQQFAHACQFAHVCQLCTCSLLPDTYRDIYIYVLRLSASPNSDWCTRVRALRLSLHARPVGPGQAWPHALVSRFDAMFVYTLARVFRFGVGKCVCSCVRAGTSVHTLTHPRIYNIAANQPAKCRCRKLANQRPCLARSRRSSHFSSITSSRIE